MNKNRDSFHGRTLASCYWRRFPVIAWPLIIAPNPIGHKKKFAGELHRPPLHMLNVFSRNVKSVFHQVLSALIPNIFNYLLLVIAVVVFGTVGRLGMFYNEAIRTQNFP